MDGSCAIIQAIQIEKPKQPETTYNFEVEEFHTYYVADCKILVHNKCGGSEESLTEIVGKAHGSAEHRAENKVLVDDMVDAGNHSKIYLNRSLHTTGVQYGCYYRPDIIGIRKDGKGFTIIEVASKSQASGERLKKLNEHIAYYEKLIGKDNVHLIPWDKYGK